MDGALLRCVLCLGVLAAPAQAGAAEPPLPGPLDAGQASPRDLPADAPQARAREQAFWVPVVEIPLMNAALATFNYFVFPDPWTRVTPGVIASNLTGPWEFDDNEFNVNSVGHPYQGSFAYLSARSAGFDFLPSMVAAGISSLTWEVFCEAERPSLNDLVTTTFGGAFLGEALYRTAAALERSMQGPVWLRFLAAVLFDPLGTFNRGLLGARYGDDALQDLPLLARLSVGINAAGGVGTERLSEAWLVDLAPELHLSGQLRSGFPATRGRQPTQPFDYFDLRGEVAMSATPWAALFVSGLLAGQVWEAAPGLQGTWGLFGGYDFSNRPVLRVATVSTGVGATALARLSEHVEVHGTAVLSAVPLGAAGTSPVFQLTERDHHLGPGGQALLELALVHRHWGSLRATGRQYLVGPGYGQDGLESVTYLELWAALALLPRLEVWVSFVASSRHATYGHGLPNADQAAHQLRMGVTWLSNADHGAATF